MLLIIKKPFPAFVDGIPSKDVFCPCGTISPNATLREINRFPERSARLPKSCTADRSGVVEGQLNDTKKIFKTYAISLADTTTTTNSSSRTAE